MRKREPLSINQPKPITLNVIIGILFFKFHFLFLHTFFQLFRPVSALIIMKLFNLGVFDLGKIEQNVESDSHF